MPGDLILGAKAPAPAYLNRRVLLELEQTADSEFYTSHPLFDLLCNHSAESLEKEFTFVCKGVNYEQTLNVCDISNIILKHQFEPPHSVEIEITLHSVSTLKIKFDDIEVAKSVFTDTVRRVELYRSFLDALNAPIIKGTKIPMNKIDWCFTGLLEDDCLIHAGKFGTIEVKNKTATKLVLAGLSLKCDLAGRL